MNTKPLKGKSVVVTRASHQNADLVKAFSELGADVVAAPAIAIVPPLDGGQPLDDALLRLKRFTSLAYNVRGINLFCYSSPAGQGTFFDRGGGIRSPTGRLNGTGGEHGHGGGPEAALGPAHLRGEEHRYLRKTPRWDSVGSGFIYIYIY